MENGLKIKINSDSKGTKVSLDNITIEAAEALKIFIDSLTELAKTYENSSDFKISLNEGSVESCLIFSNKNPQVVNDIYNILDGTSYNNQRIKILKKIQDKIHQNGLDYTINLRSDNSDIDITENFKGRPFSLKRRREEANEEIFFLRGKLFEAGGKRTTNVHIEDGMNEYKIECSIEEAIEINKFLYKTIFLSTVKINKYLSSPTYKLLDYYNSYEEQSIFENFVLEIVENDTLEKYDLLHDKIYEFIHENKINDINKLAKVFNNNGTDRGVLRTILISLKPIIHNETFSQLRPLYENLSKLLRSGNPKKKI